MIENNLKQFKITFKGLQDLYQSNEMLQVYFQQLVGMGAQQEHLEYLVSNKHIDFFSDTLSFDNMRCMYNLCDVYISPYIAEGFNITPLEALACGTPIIVPQTGSTKDYIDDISSKIPEEVCNKYIYKINTSVEEHGNKFMNKYTDNTVLELSNKVIEIYNKKMSIIETQEMESYKVLKEVLERDYSWTHVAELLENYFRDIIQDTSGT